MTQTTTRMLIALAVAAVLVGGSVAALALSDDSDGASRSAAAEVPEELQFEDLLGGLLERFMADPTTGERLPALVEDMLRILRDDLVAHFEEDLREHGDGDAEESDKAPKADKDERAPEDERAPKDEKAPRRDRAPKGDKAPKDDHDELGEHDRTPGDRDGPEAFEFPFPRIFPGESPLDEFLEDGRITPEEAEELRRWFEELFGGEGFGFGFGLEPGQVPPGRGFRFDFAPPQTDRRPGLPDVLLEGLAQLPLREFLADGELTPEEREALRGALNEWLDGLFARIDARNA